MPTYKLHYFLGRGLGEVTRLIFTYKNVPFEDIRYEQPDFQKAKSKFPFGKLPVLEVDGQQIAESLAIARYVAKQNGLAGRNDLEAAEIDALGYVIKEWAMEVLQYIFVLIKFREGDKDKMYAEHYKPAMENLLPLLEKALAASGNGYFHKSGLSWIDFLAANFVLAAKRNLPDGFAAHKSLLEHCDRIHSLPQLQTYLKKRPDTPI